MNALNERTRSLWMTELPRPSPALTQNLLTDVVVVGAGLGGLTTAYLLAKAGRKVAVIDAGVPGGGMTARTTAHLTCALDDRWYELIALRGADDATLAADAHRSAIDLVEEIQANEDIDCDFVRVDGYLGLADDDKISTLERELEASHRVGLTDVTLERDCNIAGFSACLRFPRQARFHPVKYLRGLIAAIKRDGGQVLGVRVTEVSGGERARVQTDAGFVIDAAAAIIATNTPINDRVAVHTKQAPYRTYVIAGPIAKGAAPDALLWDTGWPYHYVRIQPAVDGTHDVLIVGGEDHKTGQADDMLQRFTALEHWARARFPDLGRIMWRWSGQVMESVDYLGYLGRNPGKADNVFIITGDSGMGMTHCTIGAKIISDAILGRENAWAKLFDPTRVTVKATPSYVRENLNVAAQMADHVTPGDVSSVADIPLGSGAIVRRGAQKMAVYRRLDDTIAEHSAVCPHMGCVVAWNPLEECWDCPCHGSQFAADGMVLNGPATSDLKPVAQETETDQPYGGYRPPALP